MQVLWLKCIPKSDDLMRTYEHHIGTSRLFSDFPTAEMVFLRLGPNATDQNSVSKREM